MTLDELETVCWREGLTRPQVDAVLLAAGSYATAQAVAALAALGHHKLPEFSGMHLLDVHSETFTACGQVGVNTANRADVTCPECREAAR